MTTGESWILDSALKGLRVERETIDLKIADIEARLKRKRGLSAKEVAPPEAKQKRRMSAATRKLLSQRLKAHWAKKRKS